MADISAEWADMASNLTAITNVDVINVDDLSDYASDGATVEGLLSYGTPLPAFNCFGFKKVRKTRAVRNGAVRPHGISEGMIEGAQITNSDVLLAMASFATACGHTFTGATASYAPRIVRVTPGLGGVYTYTPFAIDHFEPSVYVRHQGSRQAY